MVGTPGGGGGKCKKEHVVSLSRQITVKRVDIQEDVDITSDQGNNTRNQAALLILG